MCILYRQPYISLIWNFDVNVSILSLMWRLPCLLICHILPSRGQALNTLWSNQWHHHHVPSSCEWLLVTSNIIFLHLSLFFASLPRHDSISPVGSVTPSIHHWCGLPLTCCPPHLASMRLFSRLLSFLIMWPKYLGLCMTIATSRELSGRSYAPQTCLLLFLVQGIFSTLLQHHSSNASMWCLVLLSNCQDSHPYIAMGKTKVVTILILDSLVSLLLFMRYLSFTIATLQMESSLDFFRGCTVLLTKLPRSERLDTSILSLSTGIH